MARISFVLLCRQSQAVAVAVVDLGHAGRGGAKDGQLPVPKRRLGQPPLQGAPQAHTGAQHRALQRPRGRQDKQLPKGRAQAHPAQLDLLLIEAVVVLTGGAADHVILRGKGLDDRPPLFGTPPGRPTTWVSREKVRSPAR